jgi:3-phenylpropionate/trans-cinnamate dioxygenase ferredoxin component
VVRVRVCAVDELEPGTVRGLVLDGVPVAVARTDSGDVHALYDQCSHARVRLSDGEVDGAAVECGLHGSRFDLATGRPLNLPATQPVRVFPVAVDEGDVYVTVEQGDIL